MKYNPDKHHRPVWQRQPDRPVWLPDRQSIRLKGYDYSQAAVYYVTVCVQDRDRVLGQIVNGEMQLNAAGQMIYDWLNQLPIKYPSIELDEFVMMPNHIHGIIIVGADPRVCPETETELPAYPDNNKVEHTDDLRGEHMGSPLRKPVPLSQIIQWFKTMTTNEYICNVKQKGWSAFNKHLWQRNYYEHIVPNVNELNRRQKYIIENPLNWDSDHANPKNMEND